MLSAMACPVFSGKSRYAGKKIIIYLTIFSLLNLFGCSFQKQMNPGEFDFEDNWDLQVTTKDTNYAISSDDYYYANDTLFAKVPIQIDERTSAKKKINIPVETIETIEAQKMDILGTVAIFGAVAFVLYALSTMGDFSP